MSNHLPETEIKNETPLTPEEVEDAYLLAIALERLAHYDPATLIPEEEMWRRFGITEEDLEGYEDVEIE